MRTVTPLLIGALLILSSLAAPVSGQAGLPSADTADLVYDGQFWPHIFANSDAAALYAFGRAQMRDLPVATSLNLALSAGELAAYIGEGALPAAGGPGFNVQADIRTHRWRIPERAVDQILEIEPSTYTLIQAFVAGLNAERVIWLANAPLLANATEPVALDLVTVQRLLSRPITILDVLANGIRANGDTSMFEADRLANDPEEDFVQDPIRTASNSWLIDAGATANGRPILLCDPHLGIDRITTIRSYFAQIKGATMDVCGISFPGWPCIAIGFNQDVAWSLTTNNPDVIDVYKAPEVAGGHFEFQDATRPILEKTLTLDVFDPATNTTSPFSTTIAWAANFDKPILRRDVDLNGIAHIWYGHASFTSAPCVWEYFLGLGRATSVPAMLQETDRNAITYTNILMADRFGNKAYLWSGRVPRRGAPTPGRTWAEVQDGTRAVYQWSEMHPASDLPREIGSSLGPAPSPFDAVWVQCNVLPDEVRPVPTIQPEDYPEYMVHWSTTPITHRQLRADQLLRGANAPSTFDISDSETISLDQRDLWWDAVKGFTTWVFQRDKRLRGDPAAHELMRRLLQWDGVADRDSAPAAMAQSLWVFYAEGLEKAEYHGLRLHSPKAVPLPGELTAVQANQSPQRFEGNIAAMTYALYRASETYPNLVNALLPGLSNPASPWTPAPWAGLTNQETVLGHTKYLDFTPSRDPLEFAIWPIGSSVESLWALDTQSYERPTDGYFAEFGLLGQTGPFFAFPVDVGSHTMLQIELGSPPVARFLEAVGPTEIVDDPRRYANASNFAAGIYADFECNESVILNDASLVLNFSYTAPDGSIGADGSSGIDD